VKPPRQRNQTSDASIPPNVTPNFEQLQNGQTVKNKLNGARKVLTLLYDLVEFTFLRFFFNISKNGQC
jgi:hypothetical protein